MLSSHEIEESLDELARLADDRDFTQLFDAHAESMEPSLSHSQMEHSLPNAVAILRRDIGLGEWKETCRLLLTLAAVLVGLAEFDLRAKAALLIVMVLIQHFGCGGT